MHSTFWKFLYDMFEKIPWHMAHAEADGLRHPMVQRLAHVGTEQNAQDGIHNQKFKIKNNDKKKHRKALCSCWLAWDC